MEQIDLIQAQRWAPRKSGVNLQLDAALTVADATAQLVRMELTGPRQDEFFREDSFWLELSFTPRPGDARARFADRWAPHHFQRMGAVLVFPPGEPLQVRSEGGVQSSIICEVPRQAIFKWLDADFEWRDRGLEAALDIPDAHIRSLLLRLRQEMRTPGFASETLVEMIFAQLALELGRYCAAVGDQGSVKGALSARHLRLIDERLDEPRAAPTLSELARLCDLSVRQLTRRFRASRGCTAVDYAAQRRMAMAKRRLAGPEPVKQIAGALGFASPSGFIYAFRRETGLTPTQYRQQLTGKR